MKRLLPLSVQPFLLVVHSYVALLGFHGLRGIVFVENGSPPDSSDGSGGRRTSADAGLAFCKSRVALVLVNPSGPRPLVARLKKFRTVHTPNFIPQASSRCLVIALHVILLRRSVRIDSR